MQQQITKIITKMIGKGYIIKPGYNDNSEAVIYNKAIKDVRKKAPEIAEVIIDAINNNLIERFGENPRILTLKRK